MSPPSVVAFPGQLQTKRMQFTFTLAQTRQVWEKNREFARKLQPKIYFCAVFLVQFNSIIAQIMQLQHDLL
jgi:hypothetical protein